MSKPLRLRIKHGLWSVFGDRTLLGMYADACYRDKVHYDEVVLEIEQTSLGYRREKGGPAEMIVPEFMPLCLINDILTMTREHKIPVSVETVEIHTEPDESY